MKPSAHLCSWHILMAAAAHSFVASFPTFCTYSNVLTGFGAVAVFLALEAAQRVGNVWLDRDPQVTGCDVFWPMWRCKRQYYSVSTTSAISISYMYDHSFGDSLGLELLHYLLYCTLQPAMSRERMTPLLMLSDLWGLTLTGTPASWVSPRNILL